MIYPATSKTKCDVKNCKNDAAYYFEIKGAFAKCFLCKSCYERIADEAARSRAPKSPQNTIKRKQEEKRSGNV